MRFPISWRRRHGGSGSVRQFSDDSAPTTAAPAGQDNVLSCKFWSTAGWPVQRVAAAWTAPTATTALTASLYVWEETLGHWLLCNDSATSMKKNQLYYFDVPTISEQPVTSPGFKTPGVPLSGGSLDCCLFLGATDDDTYTIVMAPDCTTIGT